MCIKRNAICNTTCTDSKATTKLVVVHTSYYLYIVLVLQLLVRVMLVPKVDAKSGEAAALVVFQVALVVLCLPALYYCSNPNVRPWRPFAFFMIQHC